MKLRACAGQEKGWRLLHAEWRGSVSAARVMNRAVWPSAEKDVGVGARACSRGWGEGGLFGGLCGKWESHDMGHYSVLRNGARMRLGAVHAFRLECRITI